MGYLALRVERLDEGFLLEEEGGKSYAIGTGAGMIDKVKEIFGLTSPTMPAGFESPGAPFVFQECVPFELPDVPEFRAGKTIYYVLDGTVCIKREGYGASQVFALLNDLKYLQDHPEEIKKLIENNKKYIIKGFLRDVDFKNVGVKTSPNSNSTPTPIQFSIKSGADGSEIKAEDFHKTLHIPDNKSRKEKVQECLAEGMTKEAIAEKLKMSPGTVEIIVNILSKNGDLSEGGEA